MNYKELKNKEKLYVNESNYDNYNSSANCAKMDKSQINMEVLNKIIAFKLINIMHDNGMMDEREFAKIEKKKEQFGESVIKKNKLFKGGDLK